MTAYRSEQQGYFWGRVWRPVIDFLFSPLQSRHITSYAYWARWPTAKRQAFKQAAKSVIAFEDFIDMVNGAQYVNLDLEALHGAHAQIVDATMLTQAESDAILSGPIQSIELP